LNTVIRPVSCQDHEHTADEAVYTFTVFTACFQSAHTLRRAYQSLKEQTFRDFEWLIVDDGSTDDTEVVVRKWQKEANFLIRYFYQTNRGKHEAVARGLLQARGRNFLILDADDACVPSALERFNHHWRTIDPEEQNEFAGVSALCVDQDSNLVGDEYPYSPLDTDALTLRYRYRVRGEKWGFVRTDILARFWSERPLIHGYLPEGLIWNRIAREYQTRFVNERLRVYWIGGPSLTHEQPAYKYPESGRLEHMTVLEEHMQWFRTAPLEFFKSAIHYSRFSFHCGDGVVYQFESLSDYRARRLFFIALPVAWLIYLRDRLH